MIRTFTALVALLAVAAGCATGKYVATTRYAVAPEINPAAVSPVEKTLGVRTLTAARPYKAPIMARVTPYRLDEVPYSEWAELPADAVTRAVADAIRVTGRFTDVGDASDLSLPDYVLTGEVRIFDLVEHASPWTADCTVRLELRGLRTGAAVWSATLEAAIPLQADAASALPAAMSAAISQIANEAATQIAAIELP